MNSANPDSPRTRPGPGGSAPRPIRAIGAIHAVGPTFAIRATFAIRRIRAIRPIRAVGPTFANRPIFAILLAAILALVLAACGATENSSSGSSTDASPDDRRPARAEPAPIAVRVERPKRGSISATLTTTGDLQAEEWTDLVVRRAGIVEVLRVEEGMRVRTNDALLGLERSEAEIVFEQARVEEQETQKRALLARESVAESENQVEQARLAAEKAAKEYQRFQKLSRSVVQQEELETRAYEERRTRLAQDAAENALRQARINAAIADTVAAGSVLKRRRAQIDLDFSELRAPFDGVISARHVQRGQYLAANTRAFTLVDPHNLKIEVNLPQRYLPRLEPGLRVELTTEAFPDQPFPAVLERISPVVGEKGTVKVTLRVRQQDVRLRPGMYVSVTLVLDTHENTLLASKRGVQYDTLDGVPHVFVVRGDRAVKLPVLVGYRKPTVLEIVPVPLPIQFVPVTPAILAMGGAIWLPTDYLCLRDDDRLIVAGQDRLKGGEKVNVIAGDTPAESPAETSPDESGSKAPDEPGAPGAPGASDGENASAPATRPAPDRDRPARTRPTEKPAPDAPRETEKPPETNARPRTDTPPGTVPETPSKAPRPARSRTAPTPSPATPAPSRATPTPSTATPAPSRAAPTPSRATPTPSTAAAPTRAPASSREP